MIYGILILNSYFLHKKLFFNILNQNPKIKKNQRVTLEKG